MITMHSYKSLDNLCFSDFDVLGIEIDKGNKKVQINLEGAWLVKNKNDVKELGRGYVKISNFNKLTSKFSNSISKLEGKATAEQIKELKEINDHEVGNNYLKIFGFIADGSWLECDIIGGEVEAHFIDFKEGNISC
jgi:hypothetical protein